MFAEVNPAFLVASLFFLASGCYLYLCVVTYKNNTKSKVRNDYLSAGFSLALLSFFYCLMTISVNETLIRIFWAVGFTSLCMFFARWLLFLSNMVTLRYKYTKRIFGAASALTLFLCALCVLSNDAVFYNTRYGVQFSYHNSAVFTVMIFYLALLIIASFVLEFRWRRESLLKRDKMQALLFIILTFVIAPIGFITDFTIPVITEFTAIPLASLCFLPVSMPFFISMMKYKTLSITVPNASGYIFNTVTVPTLVLDHKNGVNLENKASIDFLGRSVIGKNISDIVLCGGKPLGQSFLANGFDSEKVTVQTPRGVRVCDMLLAVEHDKYNDPLCKVVLLRDITENERKDKMLQDALLQANNASKAKSSFLSNMSHEIRTPMNAIIGMTSIGSLSSTLEKKDEAFKKIGTASKHLQGVINDILDMSKIEADKLELSSASFEFEKMLQKVADIINFRVDERRQKFYITIAKDIPHTLIGDDQRLSQVITNLLSNAVKFTPDGGTIHLDSRVASFVDDIYRIEISVSDTGIGVTEEQKSRLFKSFEQAETSTSRRFGGTGLGLVISKRIIELMGGNIRVESEPGKGAKFVFTVLLKQDTKAKKHLLDENVTWKNLRIFVVDDEPEILEFFTTLSEVWGITCASAESGEQALEMLANDKEYDMYFIDWGLPGMNGIELSRKITANAAHKSVVIIFSSIDWHIIEDEARAAGIDKFIPKPLFPSTIVDMINECIGINNAIGQDDKQSYADDFSGFTVLLAEDIEVNREIVMTLLEPTSLNIECAGDGLEALEIFSAAPEKYDLIFMDIQMPVMDGYEATRNIRALPVPRAKTVPIIAMTANVFREDIEKCMLAGMNGHLGKPLDFDEVISRLRKYLHRPEKEGN